MYRSSHQRCSVVKGSLRNFVKFTELRPATLLQKRLWHMCFAVNFAKFLVTPFLQNTSGRLLLNIIRIYRGRRHQKREFKARHLKFFLPSVTHMRNVNSLYMFFQFFFGKCSVELDKCVPIFHTCVRALNIPNTYCLCCVL